MNGIRAPLGATFSGEATKLSCSQRLCSSVSAGGAASSPTEVPASIGKPGKNERPQTRRENENRSASRSLPPSIIVRSICAAIIEKVMPLPP